MSEDAGNAAECREYSERLHGAGIRNVCQKDAKEQKPAIPSRSAFIFSLSISHDRRSRFCHCFSHWWLLSDDGKRRQSTASVKARAKAACAGELLASKYIASSRIGQEVCHCVYLFGKIDMMRKLVSQSSMSRLHICRSKFNVSHSDERPAREVT